MPPLDQESLRLNAYTGEADPGSPLHPQVARWIGGAVEAPARPLHIPPPLSDLSRWLSDDVGWGLVLPGDDSLGAAGATADDAPEPLRRLLAHRQGVVLRWSPELPVSKLRRYAPDGTHEELHLALSPRGKGAAAVPRYLLLAGTPEELPWSLQYRLNATAFTGRLDLDDEGLVNYVDAALSSWHGAGASASRVLTWSVDHGQGDITRLMRGAIGENLHQRFASNPSLESEFLDGQAAPATHVRLLRSLIQKQPGLVVTTSHGKTGPLHDVALMKQQMGTPVDSGHEVLDVDLLLQSWQPDGAIWYSHACCSAGCDSATSYDGLAAAGSYVHNVLHGVAQCGALTAPLPRRLLGAARPLRAFLGQVEPTFDWTLKDHGTGQLLTDSIAEALYQRLFQPWPIGYALETVHGQAGQLELLHRQAKRGATQGATKAERERSLREALTCRLVAQDLQSLVLLGDPAEMPHFADADP